MINEHKSGIKIVHVLSVCFFVKKNKETEQSVFFFVFGAEINIQNDRAHYKTDIIVFLFLG